MEEERSKKQHILMWLIIVCGIGVASSLYGALEVVWDTESFFVFVGGGSLIVGLILYYVYREGEKELKAERERAAEEYRRKWKREELEDDEYPDVRGAGEDAWREINERGEDDTG